MSYPILTPLDLPTLDTAPAAGSAGITRQFAYSLAGLGIPAWREDIEVPRFPQPAFFGRSVCIVRPLTAATVSTLGTDVVTAGTVTTPAISAAGTAVAQSLRTRFATSASAGTSALMRTSQAHVYRGTSALGGFLFYCRFCFETQGATQRSFIGLYGTLGDIGNVSPDSLVNMIGFGNNSSDTQLHVYTNDGSGTATHTALGASFPLNTTGIYNVFLFCTGNSAQIEYLVTLANTGGVARGVLTTNLPVNTVLLAPQCWVNNGVTASASQLALMTMYWDTNF